ncbi:MAG: ABC transporter substrate-binding protein, partial [Pseudomonadota bacterium]
MRSLVAALAAMLPLAAAAQDCAEGLRPFTHAAGTDCIPEAPQRIVTLQDQNGLLPLLELGVTPVASLGHVVDGRQVFRRLAPGMDTSGVEWVGSYRGPIDPEAIAAMSPDLIVASPFPEEAPDLLDDIAPVVVIDMFDLPLTDALMQFADLVGRTDTAEEMRAAFEAEAAEVRAALGDRLDTTTVSFNVYNPAEGTCYPVQPVQATGMGMEASGL